MKRAMVSRRLAALIASAFLLLASCGLEDLVEPDTGEPLWEEVNEPDIERCQALTMTDRGDILAGFDRGGVYRSSDGGESWVAANGGLGSMSVQCLEPITDHRIYAGTHTGLYYTDDGGDSWTEVDTVFSGYTIRGIAADISGIVLVSARGQHRASLFKLPAFFRSLDAGDTWSRLDLDIENDYVLAEAISGSGTIYIATGTLRFYRSEDRGESWTELANAPYFNYAYAIAIHPDGYLFLASNLGLHRSIDEGESWSSVLVGEPQNIIYYVGLHGDGDVYAAGYSGVFRSSDGGDTWNDIAGDMSNTNVRSVLVKPDGDIFAGTLRGSIFRSQDDGASWRQVNETGIISQRLTDLALGGDGLVIAGAERDGVYRSTDGGKTWQNVEIGGYYDHVAVVTIDGTGTAFAGVYRSSSEADGGVYRSMDGGLTWLQAGLEERSVDKLRITPAGALLAATDEGLFRSSDNGQTWIHIEGDWENRTVSLAITERGYVFMLAGGALYRSKDDGANWTKIDSRGPSLNTSIAGFTEASNGHLFVAARYAGIFRSTDDGRSWEKVLTVESDIPVVVPDPRQAQPILSLAGDLKEFEIKKIEHTLASIAAGPEGYLIAGTNWYYLYFSNDDGETWHRILPQTASHHYYYKYYYFDPIVFDSGGRILTIATRRDILRSILPLE